MTLSRRERAAATSFLEALDAESAVELRSFPDLGAKLVSLADAARTAWPGVELDDSAFFSHVAAHLSDGVHLEALHHPDLYLARALASGDERAVAIFETRYVPTLQRALQARVNAAAATLEDIRQQVVTRLLFADAKRSPLILRYGGRGPLSRWLSVVAVRAALKQIERDKREPARPTKAGAVSLGAKSPTVDPELACLKESYREHFQTALQEALNSLQRKERQLLALHVIDGRDLAYLGRKLGVHRRTVGRWIESIQQKVYENTRDLMLERVPIDPSELDSIRRLVQSRVDITLRMKRKRSR